jgi:Rha family phage regulatory protein
MGIDVSTKFVKNELGIFVKNETPVVSSRDIAERFRKEHKNVLQSIDNLECSAEFRRLNFQPISYRDAMNRSQREYLITKDGFVFLVMGFTGKEAAVFKEKYIAAFNYMQESLKYRHVLKISFSPMTDAIKEAHETPQFYHYTNEINMIYKIVLGKDAKTYRLEKGLSDDTDIKDHRLFVISYG